MYVSTRGRREQRLKFGGATGVEFMQMFLIVRSFFVIGNLKTRELF